MYKEVDVSNKKQARIRIWASAWKWHQPPHPHLISESSFSLLCCAPLPQVDSLLGWSQQGLWLKSWQGCASPLGGTDDTKAGSIRPPPHTHTPEQRQVQEGTVNCSCHTGVHVALTGQPPYQESCSNVAIGESLFHSEAARKGMEGEAGSESIGTGHFSLG